MAAAQIILAPRLTQTSNLNTSNLKLQQGRQGTATSADKLPLLPLGPGGVGLPKIHGPWRRAQRTRPGAPRNRFWLEVESSSTARDQQPAAASLRSSASSPRSRRRESGSGTRFWGRGSRRRGGSWGRSARASTGCGTRGGRTARSTWRAARREYCGNSTLHETQDFDGATFVADRGPLDGVEQS